MHRLDGQLVGLYLSSLIQTVGAGSNRTTTIRGKTVDGDDLRRYRSWRDGEYDPTLWRLDRFLTRYGLHVNEFFAWCPTDPWIDGVPWYELEVAA